MTMKIGEFVRSNVGEILSLCQRDPTELVRLMDRAYCKRTFNLNWPFFADADSLPPTEHVRYWKDRYVCSETRLRACSQWFGRNRDAFERYLRSKGIANPDMPEPSAGIKPPYPGPGPRGRYKATAIGDAQNLFIRVLLSNIGPESFTRLDWEQSISYFDNRCAYCGESSNLHMDHAVPINKSNLGEHKLGNLIPSCKSCNDAKHYAHYREFLADNPERLAKIEGFMTAKKYLPLDDNRQLRKILDQAHEDVRLLAQRYIAIIMAVLDDRQAV